MFIGSTASGHWVTINGAHVLIGGPAVAERPAAAIEEPSPPARPDIATAARELSAAYPRQPLPPSGASAEEFDAFRRGQVAAGMRTAAGFDEAAVAKATAEPTETGPAAIPALKAAADLYDRAHTAGLDLNYARADIPLATGEQGPAIGDALDRVAAVRGQAESAVGRAAGAVAEGLPEPQGPIAATPATLRRALIVAPAEIPDGARTGLTALAAKATPLDTNTPGLLVVKPEGDARRALSAIENAGGPAVGVRFAEHPDEAGKALWDSAAAPAERARGGRVKQLSDAAYVQRRPDGSYRLLPADKARARLKE